jgi:hypothetical protein
MDSVLRDLVLAARLLRRRPGFSALAITILAVAIGANSAIFSVVNAVLLRAPAFEAPEHLVAVWERRFASATDRNVVAAYNYLRWRERARSFTDMAAFTASSTNLSGSGDPERLDAGAVTGNLFAVLGVRAHAGRTLVAEDSRPGAPKVAVISEGLWRRRFGGDPGIVGRSVNLDGSPATVVGVMPQSFQPWRRAVWVPLGDDAVAARGRWMTVVARLQPRATLAQAREEMKSLAADLARENPEFDTLDGDGVPLHADPCATCGRLAVLVGESPSCSWLRERGQPALARAVGREREVAVRPAGARPARLVQQLTGARSSGDRARPACSWARGCRARHASRGDPADDAGGPRPHRRPSPRRPRPRSCSAFPALHQARPALVPSLRKVGRRGPERGPAPAQGRAGRRGGRAVGRAGRHGAAPAFWNLAHVDAGFRRGRAHRFRQPARWDVRHAAPATALCVTRSRVSPASRAPFRRAIGVLPLSRGGSAARFYLMDAQCRARRRPRAT